MDAIWLEKLAKIFKTLLPYQPLTYGSLAITAVALILFTVRRKKPAGENSRQRLIAGLAKALAFIGMVVLVSVLLERNYAAFSAVYGSFTTGGSLSNQAFEPWHQLYGEGLVQKELQVTQFVKVTSTVPVAPEEPNQPVKYLDITKDTPLEQDSIRSFDGYVTLNLVNPRRQEDSFNAFVAAAQYTYEINNPSEQVTRAHFNFPIDAETRLYRNIHIRVNGQEFNGWKIGYDSGLEWDQPMRPGQVDTVEIDYTAWGMNDYAYVVDKEREVRNFRLALAFETDNH